MFSVVIPAHNEAGVIARCLHALQDGLPANAAQIIVVCNGCTDDTAVIARRFEGVTVIELAQASKVAALNCGDRAASAFPIAYIDADIELRGADLCKALAHFDSAGIEVVAPRLQVDLSRSNIWVRAFYAVWMRLPYFSQGQMVGSGVFILSQAGRGRFGDFPQVIADDGYVRSLFGAGERRMASDCSFKIFAPRNLADLIKIKTRVRFGNMELRQKYPSQPIGGENSGGALLALVLRRPWLLPAAALYAYVQWQTKRGAQQRMAQADFSTWERDESSRA